MTKYEKPELIERGLEELNRDIAQFCDQNKDDQEVSKNTTKPTVGYSVVQNTWYSPWAQIVTLFS